MFNRPKSEAERAAQEFLELPAVKAALDEKRRIANEAARDARRQACEALRDAEAQCAQAAAHRSDVQTRHAELQQHLMTVAAELNALASLEGQAQARRAAAERNLQAFGESTLDYADRLLTVARHAVDDEIQLAATATVVGLNSWGEQVRKQCPKAAKTLMEALPRIGRIHDAEAQIAALRRADMVPADIEAQARAIVEAAGCTWPVELTDAEVVARSEANEAASRVALASAGYRVSPPPRPANAPAVAY